MSFRRKRCWRNGSSGRDPATAGVRTRGEDFVHGFHNFLARPAYAPLSLRSSVTFANTNMLNYLEKFNSLPYEIREKVTGPEVMRAITELEEKYQITLATIIMRVMVKDIPWADLVKYFEFEEELSREQSEILTAELKGKVFFEVLDYLNIVGGEEIKQVEPATEQVKADIKGEESLADWMREREAKTKKRETGFYFSAEDEEEVKEQARKLADFTKEPPAKDNIDKIAERVSREAGITFSTDELGRRFQAIIKTYLKGVRNKIDTKQTLMKSIDQGGLELAEDAIDKILGLADELRAGSFEESEETMVAAAISSLPAVEAEEPLATGQEAVQTERGQNIITDRDLPYDFSKLAKPGEEKNARAEPESEAEPPDTTQEPTDRSMAETKSARGKDYLDLTNISGAKEDKEDSLLDTEQPTIEPKPLQAEIQGSAGTAAEKKTEAPAVDQTGPVDPAAAYIEPGIKADKRTAGNGKKRMEDVKYVPKLLGPIDELRELDLANFRRLGKDASEAAIKIRDKIKFLEEENYSQRLAGIKAWRESPVNGLYLAIGRESISENKPINVIIEARRNAGREYLSSHEFEAVMDLNKELRF